MIIDARAARAEKLPAPHVIIVGSGPVGLTLALSLMRRKVRVLVLEAGGEHATPEDTRDLEVEFDGAPLEGAAIGRSRQIGGGLNLWGGQLACFEPREFNCDATDGTTWPLPLSSLLQRIEEVAHLLGQSGLALPYQPADLAREDLSLKNCGLGLVATAWLARPKLSSRIWRQLAASSDVTIAHGAFIDRIDIDPFGNVRGVSALCRDGTRWTIAASRVVLACGTIETSRLLLQPSEAGAAQPWHHLPWLGRGFNEHLDAMTAVIQPRDRTRLLDIFDPMLVHGTKYTFKLHARVECGPSGPQSAAAMMTLPFNIRNSITELALLVRGMSPKGVPASARSIASAALASSREIVPLAVRYLRNRRIGSILRGNAMLRVFAEQPSRPDSRIRLSKARTDSRGVRTARLTWAKGEEEGRTFLETTQRIKRWAEREGIARVEIDPALMRDPAAFAESADEGLHHAGGTRMAIDHTNGVVDPNLEVFETRGLYCCGASVFPRSGYANPTLTAMALAVRLSDHLITSRVSA